MIAEVMRDAHAARLARRARGASACPCGPINKLDAGVRRPAGRRARHAAATLPHPLAGTRAAGRARRSGMSATPPALERAPPLLGEHTRAGAARAARTCRRRRSRALAARGVIGIVHDSATENCLAADAPRFLDRLRAALAIALAIAWRLFPQAIPIVNLDITMTRAAGGREARGARVEACARARRRANRRRVQRGRRRRRATSSSKAAARRHSRSWSRARLTRRIGGRCGCSSPASIDETTIRFRPDGAPNGFSRRVPRPTFATRRRKRFRPKRRSRSREERAQRRLEMSTSRPTRCSSSRSRRGRPAASTTRSCSSAPRGSARRAFALRLDGRRRRADRDRAVRARSRILRAPLPRNAQRERHDRRRRQLVGGRSLRPRRLHLRRAVALRERIGSPCVPRSPRVSSSAR